MKIKIKNGLPAFLFLFGAAFILAIGYWIYREPYEEAEKRNTFEDKIIEGYLETDAAGNPDTEPDGNASAEYMYSDVNDYAFQGNLDGILVIDKINLKKAIIRGNNQSDNEFNLSRYYFVTADLTADLDGNYIIYGHCSDTYGHSFNRLDELNIGDTFYLLRQNTRYNYRVEAVDRVLRSESSPYFPELKSRVTLVSCEKTVADGYTENRVIIVRAVQEAKESIQ